MSKYEEAFDRSCNYIADSLGECPVSQDLVDDLDCENCSDNYVDCWKKYFMEVLENE